MITYSVHVALLLALCLLFYKLLLQKETYYHLNRAVLLLCLCVVFLLPLVPVPQQLSLRASIFTPSAQPDAAQAVSTPVYSQPVSITPQKDAVAQPMPTVSDKPALHLSRTQMLKWILWIYACGVVIFGANFLLQIVSALYQSYRRRAIRDGFYRIVELDGDKAPCSFGNTIFINPAKYDWETYSQVLMHEKVHIQQGHSLDLILAELMLVVQWFNPFAWLYRKEIEKNLEFLTDDAIIHRHKVALEDYQVSLLKVSVPNYATRITTNYNQSLLRKRIVMMNAKRSNVHTSWKYLVLFPLLAAFVCGFNEPVALSMPLATSSAPRLIEPVKTLVNTSLVSNKADSTRKSPKVLNASAADHLASGKVDTARKRKVNKAKLTVVDGTVVKANSTTTAEVAMAQADDNTEIDPAYLKGLQEIGYDTKNKKGIRALEKADISVAYIKALMSIGYKDLSAAAVIALDKQDISVADITALMQIGYKDVSVGTLIALDKADITPGDVKSYMSIGYPDVSANSLIALDKADITAGDVKSYMSIGYPNLSVNSLIALDKAGITAGDIKSYISIGYPDLSVETLIKLDKADITAGDIKSYMSIGYPDLSVATLIGLQNADISAGDIRSYMSIGYPDVSLLTLMALRSADISAGDIKSYMSIGYKDVTVPTLVTLIKADISAPYINSLMSIGYKDLSVPTLVSLYKHDISAPFIKSFMSIGYKDVSVKAMLVFKANDISAPFVKNIDGFATMKSTQIQAIKAKQ